MKRGWPEIVAAGAVALCIIYALRDFLPRLWAGSDLVADWTAVLAFATFGAVVISLLQIRYVARADAAGQELARVQLQSIEEERVKTAISMRAYLSVDSLKLEVIEGKYSAWMVKASGKPLWSYPHDSVVWRIGIRIYNTGSVPATNVRLNVGASWHHGFFEKIDDSVLREVPEHAVGMIAPRAEIFHKQGFVRGLDEQASFVSFVGRIRYFDGFSSQERDLRFGFNFGVLDRELVPEDGRLIVIEGAMASRVADWNREL